MGFGLDIVFIGINPSLYSVQQGHYFARKTNRFWPSLSASILSLPARCGLGVERLLPEHDRALLDYGIGFTDVVKRPSARADELSAEEYAEGAADLMRKLQRCRPRVACFQGMMGFRPFAKALDPPGVKLALGEQGFLIGHTRVFVIPNPSPANAHASLAVQTEWSDRLSWVIGADAG